MLRLMDLLIESKADEIESTIRQSFLMNRGSFNTGWKMPKRTYVSLIKSLKKRYGSLVDKIVKELEKYENFHWLGKLEYPNKVREFLSEIDVYALITGMDLAPLSLKEAQLMKRPVIATDVGGNPEMMKDGVTGFLVEKGNHKQLIEKIKLLLADKKLSEQMGNEGRKFIEETYSWEVATKKFIQILNSHVKK